MNYIPKNVTQLPSGEMKEAAVYRSEFINYDCPYCGHVYHLDTADMIHEGSVDGMKTNCIECGKLFYLSEGI